MDTANTHNDELFRRIRHDVIDSLDEELEMELEDREPVGREGLTVVQTAEDRSFRTLYFRELIRLQNELVSLQEWLVASGHKMVILFEGRDAAGKGA
jgi:polyphosphate kinase